MSRRDAPLCQTPPALLSRCPPQPLATASLRGAPWRCCAQERWSSSDMVDCILSYAATRLMGVVSSSNDEARRTLDVLRQDPRAAQQFLLLVHLYARTDTYSLAWLRAVLLRAKYSPLQVAAGVGVATTLLVGGVAAARSPAVSEAVSEQADWVWEHVESAVPPLQVW
jgi:hypothetical protein